MKDLSDKGIGAALSDGQTLFAFLGSFWRHVYEDPDFIERFCEAMGLFSAQAEQKKNEAKAASGRLFLPPFTRERWFRVVLSRDSKNICDSTKVTLSESAPAIGPQDAGTRFIRHAIPMIGAHFPVDGSSFYPVPKYLVSATSVHERVFDPEVKLDSGVDFEIIDGAISFSAGKDPCFDSRFRKDPDSGDTVVWLKDAMIDNNLVSDYAGYVVKMNLESSKRNLDIVNAFWNIVNTGATPAGLSYFLSKLFGVGEADVQPVSSSMPGMVFVDSGFFSDDLKHGLGFPTTVSNVRFCGWGEDNSENPKYPRLMFDVYGEDEDVSKFFSGCWERCENSGVDMSKLFGVSVVPSGSDVQVSGSIVPAKFVLDNLVGSRSLFFHLPAEKIDAHGLRLLKLLQRVVEVSPAGLHLSFTLSIGHFEEQCDCNVTEENVIVPEAMVANSVNIISDDLAFFMVPAKEVNNT